MASPCIRHLISSSQSGILQSGILQPRDPVDRRDERLPGAALRGQHLLTFLRQAIVAAAALPGLLHPASLEPAALFETIEQRIEGCDVEAQDSVRTHLNQFPDLITMARAGFNQ